VLGTSSVSRSTAVVTSVNAATKGFIDSIQAATMSQKSSLASGSFSEPVQTLPELQSSVVNAVDAVDLYLVQGSTVLVQHSFTAELKVPSAALFYLRSSSIT
jgi:hypothetical protein